MGRYTETLADYDAAIRLDPKLAAAYHSVASPTTPWADPPRRWLTTTQAIRLDPNNAQAYGNRGAAYYALGRSAEALADCDAAIRLDPNLASVCQVEITKQTNERQPARAVILTDTIRRRTPCSTATAVTTLAMILFLEPAPRLWRRCVHRPASIGGRTECVGHALVRIQPDRLGEIRDGFVVGSLALVSVPPGQEGHRRRIEPDRLPEIGHFPVVFAFPPPGEAPAAI